MTRKPAKIFFGWWIVIASFLIAFYVAGVVQYGFTALFEPIANEMDWSYAHIALAASLRGVEMSLLAPIAGIFADRWGPRITILIGATIAAMGLSLLSRVTSLVMFYGAFALIAMGISGCTMTVLMAAVARWFRKKVGLATGIAVCGFGTSGLLIPGIVKLIDMYEWRTATNILALGMLVWILPLSFVFRHKPEQYGYLPDGAVEEPIKHMHDRNLQSASEVGMTAKQALQSGVFWRIALVYTCNVMFISTVITHIMPYLSNVGIARSLSSVVATALPLISIGGRLGFGWIGDAEKVNRRLLLAVTFAMMGFGLLCFEYVSIASIWLIVPFLFFYGIGYGGCVALRPSLLMEYFGVTSFGAILGFMIGMNILGTLLGPTLTGWVYDNFGNYRGVWFAFASFAILTLLFIMTIPTSKIQLES